MTIIIFLFIIALHIHYSVSGGRTRHSMVPWTEPVVSEFRGRENNTELIRSTSACACYDEHGDLQTAARHTDDDRIIIETDNYRNKAPAIVSGCALNCWNSSVQCWLALLLHFFLSVAAVRNLDGMLWADNRDVGESSYMLYCIRSAPCSLNIWHIQMAEET